MAKTEIRMTGSGGQGVIMGTIIIAEAAYDDGKQVIQCQAYGPEARGGSSKAEAIVITHVATQEAMERAVLNHVPKGTGDTNLAALRLGGQMIRDYEK